MQSPLAFQLPSIPRVALPTHFNEAITFTSPEVSARMENTIKTSKLNEFSLVARQKKPSAHSVSSRNQRPTVFRTSLQSTQLSDNPLPVNSADFCHKSSLDDTLLSLQAFPVPASAALRNKSLNRSAVVCGINSTSRDMNELSNSERNALLGQTHTMKLQPQALAQTSRDDPMVWMSQPWLKEGSLNHVYQTYQAKLIASGLASPQEGIRSSKTGSNGCRRNKEQARPSVVSEGIAGAALMKTKIPYRNSTGDHNLKHLQQQQFQAPLQRHVQQYGVAQPMPMSPSGRQSLTLDKIQMMTLKAQGKLLPGQPSAKQFAEQ